MQEPLFGAQVRPVGAANVDEIQAREALATYESTSFIWIVASGLEANTVGWRGTCAPRSTGYIALAGAEVGTLGTLREYLPQDLRGSFVTRGKERQSKVSRGPWEYSLQRHAGSPLCTARADIL